VESCRCFNSGRQDLNPRTLPILKSRSSLQVIQFAPERISRPQRCNNQPRPEAVVLGRPPEGAVYVRLPPLGACSWSSPGLLLGCSPFLGPLRSAAEAWRHIVVLYVCRDRAEGLWQFGLRSKPACRTRRTAVRGCRLIDTTKPGRPTCGLRRTCRLVG